MPVSALPLIDYDTACARSEGQPLLRAWLAVMIFLVFAMVVVGGATRLTDSGLSITEWKPIHGAVPPLGEAAWQEEFDRYRQTSQYEILNQGMSLAEFKVIFWWEWGHRQLGRLIGLLYAAGFVWAVATSRVDRRRALALFAMGLLLATQGLVGWIMVASGLEPGMTAVAPVKLTLHLTLACLFFAALVAMHARLGAPRRVFAAPAVRYGAWILAGLTFAQIALGGLVAGHDAGLTYNTWPLMDGSLVPSGLAALQPYWLNLVDNVTAIQFNHRLGAYVLVAAAAAYSPAAWPTASLRGRREIVLIVSLLLAQFGLGVLTLVYVVPLALALAHQALALVLLGAVIRHASLTGRA